MKKNNHGFMLAELIISSTVIMTAMIGFYASFSKLYTSYTEKNHYYSVDGTYATIKLVDSLIDNNIFNNYINKTATETNINYIIKNKNCVDSDINLCQSIQNFYNIQNMVLLDYDKNYLEKLKKENINETFKDYLDYVIEYYSFDDEYDYIIVTEGLENDDNYYSNVRIR